MSTPVNGALAPPQNKLLDQVVQPPARNASPLPTHMSLPGSGHSTPRVLPSEGTGGSGYVAPKFEGKEKQMEEVMDGIEEKGFLPSEFVETETTWFYNELGIDDMYFATETVDTIVNHILSLYAAKVAAYARQDKRIEIRLDKEADDHAVYIDTSRPGISVVDGPQYEKRIGERYLHRSKDASLYRVESFRSASSLPGSQDQQLRCYFVYQCDFVDPSPSPTETNVEKIGDKRFLQKATANTKKIYQDALEVAVERTGPVIEYFDIEGSRDKRLVIAYKQGTALGFFSALSDLYHYYEALPLILNPPYANLVAQAHNGSGKTVCFILAMLSRVDPSLYEPQALCICPTRELALQNQAVLRKMATYAGISDISAVPSDNRDGRVSRRPPVHDHVVIGTPGTMKRWITVDRCLSLKNVKIIVFDEADFMLDTAGFQDESVRMLRAIVKDSPNCQILLFSATFNEKVKTFVERMIPRANKVFVAKEELSLDVIKQYRVRCPSVERKIEVLKDRIYPLAEKLGQSIIFARTRESVRQLHQKLEEDGYRCTPIEGGQRPDERDRVIQDFRTGKTRILISTDVLARGFDVAQVTLVVNFDLPEVQGGRYREPDYETYLHRIGRSGRFGRKGAAFNFTSNDEDERVVDKIENYFKKKIPPVRWDDDDDFERVMKEAGLR